MNKNKNFLDQLDGGWEDLIADTYSDATANNTIFAANNENGEKQIYNVSKENWNKLFEIEMKANYSFDSIFGTIKIPADLIEDKLCTGNFSDIKYIEITATLLYNSMLNTPSKKSTKTIDFTIFNNYKQERSCFFSIASDGKLSQHKANNKNNKVIYINKEFVKYLVTELIKDFNIIAVNNIEYKKEQNTLYNLIEKINLKNSSYGRKEIE